MSITIDPNNGHSIGEFNGVKVRITEYKGKRYVDMRKFFTDKQTNADVPTKKGINVALDDVSTLVDLLTKVEEMKQKGEV